MSNKLKPASILILVTLVLLASTIQDALSKETAKFVGDNESAHHGLPLEWNGDQVICILFPPDYPHAEFNYGVTMIDSDGTTLGVNENYNGTGACIGGFEGYGEGLEFMMDATRAVGGLRSRRMGAIRTYNRGPECQSGHWRFQWSVLESRSQWGDVHGGDR